MNSEAKLNLKKIMRGAVKAVVIILLFSLPLFYRSYAESKRALREGLSAQNQGQTRLAIEKFAHAVRWRGLFNAPAEDAQKELSTLWSKLEGPDRVYALKELRKALLISRSFYFSGSEKDPAVVGIDQELLALGARTPSPITVLDPFHLSFRGQIAAQISFWGWILSTLTFIYYGFTREGAFKGRKALFGLFTAVVFFAAWLAALTIA